MDRVAAMKTKIETVADPYRVGKAYTIAQAAVLADASRATIRNWLYGYQADEYELMPVFGGRERPGESAAPAVSFLELAELIVVARYRRLKIRLNRIRRAHEFARREWNLDYPFASINLTSLGGHILHRFEQEEPGPGKFVVLSAPEQYVLPGIVRDELSHFDFEESDPEGTDPFALRWYPYGRTVPVVVDPRFAGGRPTIAGRGVTIEIIRRRWKAGESFEAIARDFRLKPPVVEAVLQHVA